jgi:hypothetical protein
VPGQRHHNTGTGMAERGSGDTSVTSTGRKSEHRRAAHCPRVGVREEEKQ